MKSRSIVIDAIIIIAIACVLASLSGCAHRRAMRALERIETRCVAALEVATSEPEIDAIHARCRAQIEEVTRGR